MTMTIAYKITVKLTVDTVIFRCLKPQCDDSGDNVNDSDNTNDVNNNDDCDDNDDDDDDNDT